MTGTPNKLLKSHVQEVKQISVCSVDPEKPAGQLLILLAILPYLSSYKMGFLSLYNDFK